MVEIPVAAYNDNVRLAIIANQGDNEARNSLILNNRPLVFKIAGKYSRSSFFDDIIQEGMLGLIDAAKNYNPKLINPETKTSFKFSTYAFHAISDRIRKYIKRSIMKHKCYSLDAQFGEKEELSDVVGVEYDVSRGIAMADARFMALDIIEALTDKEKLVIKLRYGIDCNKGHTLKDVGSMLGMTRERVRQIELKAVHKMHYTYLKQYKHSE